MDSFAYTKKQRQGKENPEQMMAPSAMKKEKKEEKIKMKQKVHFDKLCKNSLNQKPDEQQLMIQSVEGTSTSNKKKRKRKRRRKSSTNHVPQTFTFEEDGADGEM